MGAYKAFFLSVSLLIITGSSYAEIYKWTDENGQVHFSDRKPANQAVTEVEIEPEIGSYESVSYGTFKVKAPKPAPKDKVVMLSASWCGYCKQARTYFKKNSIRYTDYDVEQNPRGKKLYKQMGATGVPVILVGNKRMNGFSESGFERLYK